MEFTHYLSQFTMQEKLVPLLKGIKTKEPAVMVNLNATSVSLAW